MPGFLVPEAIFRPTAAGATIHWISEVPVDAQVLAGPSPAALAPVYEGRSIGSYEVVIADRPEDATWFVKCRFRPENGEWIDRPIRELHTARAGRTSFRFAVLADSHQYTAGPPARMQNLHATMQRILGDRVDFVVFVGDEAGVHSLSPPPATSMAEADRRWRRWREVVDPILSAIPSFLVLGNHEGESGFDRRSSFKGTVLPLQRWAATARKRYLLNPLPTTYPEGGEDDGWRDPLAGPEDTNNSPLQNYFAWTWGDALFVVLDVHRYTRIDESTPTSPEQWTLGNTQLAWFERVLAQSIAREKFVIAHHLVGGWRWGLRGNESPTDYAYGRGGARYARVGEQARVTELMLAHGARYFLYGHDHVFAYQQAERLHFVCCGRPTFLQPAWWATPGWAEAYGQRDSRNPNDFYAAVGYTRVTVDPAGVTIEYIRTGSDENANENVETPIGGVVYANTIRSMMPSR